MSDEVHWLPNWKGTRLHAVVGPEPQKVVLSACGIRAYPMNARDHKRIAKGIVIPRCKRCLAFFRENKQTAAVFLDAESREALAATGTEARVCQDIAWRQRGVSKYGFTVEGNPLPLISWLWHAYEECLDQAAYLRRAIDEIEQSRDAQLRNAPANPRQEGGSK